MNTNGAKKKIAVLWSSSISISKCLMTMRFNLKCWVFQVVCIENNNNNNNNKSRRKKRKNVAIHRTHIVKSWHNEHQKHTCVCERESVQLLTDKSKSWIFYRVKCLLSCLEKEMWILTYLTNHVEHFESLVRKCCNFEHIFKWFE